MTSETQRLTLTHPDHKRRMQRASRLTQLMVVISMIGITVRAEQPTPSPMDRNLLVQKACDKEIDHAKADRAWILHVTRIEAGVTQTFQRVETSQGDVQRLLTINGKPATGADKDKNDAMLHSLWTDLAARQKQISTHESDTRDEVKYLSRIPQMYLFRDIELKGTLRRVHFEPNPNFTPADYKERVLHTLNGDLLIDTESLRFVELNATVTKPLSFGFGLLGYLKQGGSIHLRRELALDNELKSKELKVNLEGKILLIKDIGKHQSERFDTYTLAPVPCDLLCGLRILGAQ